MDHAAARRLLTALELHDLGVAMMAQRLRRVYTRRRLAKNEHPLSTHRPRAVR